MRLARELRNLVRSEWHVWWVKHHARRYARHRDTLRAMLVNR